MINVRNRGPDSFDALMDLTRFYMWEAEKCEQQRAYLGESIRRPTIAAALIVIMFALVRSPLPPMLLSSLAFSQPDPTVTGANLATNPAEIISATWVAFLESVYAFFQLRAEDSMSLAERLLSIPLLGLLFIAMRRKLERR